MKNIIYKNSILFTAIIILSHRPSLLSIKYNPGPKESITLFGIEIWRTIL